jgi:chromosome segregation and condensation protein ScpB
MKLQEIYDKFAEKEVGPLEASGACEKILRGDPPGKSKAYEILEEFRKEMKLNEEEYIGLVKMVQAPLLTM